MSNYFSIKPFVPEILSNSFKMASDGFCAVPTPKPKTLKFEWEHQNFLSRLFFLIRDRKPWHQDLERKWSDGTWLFELVKRPNDKYLRVKLRYSRIDGPIRHGFGVSLMIEHGDTVKCVDYRRVTGRDAKEERVFKPNLSLLKADGNEISLKNVNVRERYYTFEWRIDQKILQDLVVKEGEPDPKDGIFTILEFRIKRIPLN